jgi:hypothetical protein
MWRLVQNLFLKNRFNIVVGLHINILQITKSAYNITSNKWQIFIYSFFLRQKGSSVTYKQYNDGHMRY